MDKQILNAIANNWVARVLFNFAHTLYDQEVTYLKEKDLDKLHKIVLEKVDKIASRTYFSDEVQLDDIAMDVELHYLLKKTEKLENKKINCK